MRPCKEVTEVTLYLSPVVFLNDGETHTGLNGSTIVINGEAFDLKSVVDFWRENTSEEMRDSVRVPLRKDGEE